MIRNEIQITEEKKPNTTEKRVHSMQKIRRRGTETFRKMFGIVN